MGWTCNECIIRLHMFEFILVVRGHRILPFERFSVLCNNALDAIALVRCSPNWYPILPYHCYQSLATWAHFSAIRSISATAKSPIGRSEWEKVTALQSNRTEQRNNDNGTGKIVTSKRNQFWESIRVFVSRECNRLNGISWHGEPCGADENKPTAQNLIRLLLRCIPKICIFVLESVSIVVLLHTDDEWNRVHWFICTVSSVFRWYEMVKNENDFFYEMIDFFSFTISWAIQSVIDVKL